MTTDQTVESVEKYFRRYLFVEKSNAKKKLSKK
jgi:hypothetical protein